MAKKVVGDLVVRLEAQTERFNRELEKARAANKRFERQARRSKSSISAMGAAMRRLIPVLGAAAFVNFARRQIAIGDALAKTSRRLGLSVEQYSSLAFQAKQAGVELAVMDKAVQRFGVGIGEANLGTGELKNTLGTLGISVQNSGGGLKTTSELLTEFAQRVGEVEDPMQRLSFVADAFGQRGATMAELLPVLAGGFEDIQKAAAGAGVLIETATAESLERAQNAIDRFSVKVSAFFTRFFGSALQSVFPDLERKIENAQARIRSLNRALTELKKYDVPGSGNFIAGGGPELLKNLNTQMFILRDLVEEKQKLAASDRQAIVDAETLRERYEGFLAVLARASSGRQGIGTVLRLDFRDQLGPLGSRFKAVESKMTDTQEVIVDGTRSAMGAFTREISSALTAAEFRFDRFASNVAASLATLITQKLITSAIVNPLLGSLGVPGFAAGGVFSGGRVERFARGGVVTRPTLFPMAGGAGLMGEAGPEAVLPLRRSPSGELGVVASGSSGVFAPSITIHYTPASSDPDESLPAQMASEMRKMLADLWRTQYQKERRTGGVLNPIA